MPIMSTNVLRATHLLPHARPPAPPQLLLRRPPRRRAAACDHTPDRRTRHNRRWRLLQRCASKRCEQAACVFAARHKVVWVRRRRGASVGVIAAAGLCWVKACALARGRDALRDHRGEERALGGGA